MGISYHCNDHIQVNKVQDFFFDKGYTFNGEDRKMVVGSQSDGLYKVLLHINHEKKDISYDYYYCSRWTELPNTKLARISLNRTVLDSNVLFRDEKLKSLGIK